MHHRYHRPTLSTKTTYSRNTDDTSCAILHSFQNQSHGIRAHKRRHLDVSAKHSCPVLAAKEKFTTVWHRAVALATATTSRSRWDFGCLEATRSKKRPPPRKQYWTATRSVRPRTAQSIWKRLPLISRRESGRHPCRRQSWAKDSIELGGSVVMATNRRKLCL